MQISDYRTFIFDWDGTLSTSTFLVRISRFFKRRYGADYITAHANEYTKGSMSESRIMRNAEENEIHWSVVYEFLYSIYLVFGKPKPREGAIELLQYLRSKRKQIAIFSDGKRYRLIRELRMLGMADYIDFLISADEINAFKPYPDGLNTIVRSLKSEKSKSIYIGDMPVDVFTAKFAGITSCAVLGGMSNRTSLKKAKPDFIFDSLEELRKAL
ncbi:MAG: HAD hydrolase-like protein [Candidatus Micrarchaeaceae archaeon]